MTFTGEFLHAAPWSVSAQGSYNVSHGCVGMSTDNAAWLFNLTHRGDPVEVTGTQRGLEDKATGGPTGTSRTPSTSRLRRCEARLRPR